MDAGQLEQHAHSRTGRGRQVALGTITGDRRQTLQVLGSEERKTPARAGLKLAALIPSAKATLLQGTGHMMMVEQPDQTLDVWKGGV